MVDVVPPLRTEAFFNAAGDITIRYAEYFEGVADTITDIDVLIALFEGLSNSSAGIANVNKRIKDLEDGLAPDVAAISQLNKRINDLELLVSLGDNNQLSNLLSEFQIVEVTADYTSIGKEIIICSNVAAASITVTLRDSPNDKDEVHIVRKDGPVSFISAAGINGSTTAIPILDAKGAPHLIFTTIAGEYSIV